MDTSVYIFIILLDAFIVFTIFAIYFYVLFRYFLHEIESNSIISFFNIHIQFYKPVLTLFKQYSKTNGDDIKKSLQSNIDNTTNEHDDNSFSTGTIIILSTILGLFAIVLVCFILYYKKIIEQVSLNSIIFTIIINIIMIIGIELLFLFFVYCNLDVVNIAEFLNVL